MKKALIFLAGVAWFSASNAMFITIKNNAVSSNSFFNRHIATICAQKPRNSFFQTKTSMQQILLKMPKETEIVSALDCLKPAKTYKELIENIVESPQSKEVVTLLDTLGFTLKNYVADDHDSTILLQAIHDKNSQPLLAYKKSFAYTFTGASLTF